MFGVGTHVFKSPVLIGGPKVGIAYKCVACDVHGIGSRCWCCGREDLKLYANPALANPGAGGSIRDGTP